MALVKKLIRKPHTFLTEDKNPGFISLPPEFNWYMTFIHMEASGYIQNNFITIDVIPCYPLPISSLDTKMRNKALAVTASLGERMYFSGLNLTIEYPPTQYRFSTTMTRNFNFSD